MLSNNKLITMNGVDTLYYFVKTEIEKYSIIYDEISRNIDNEIYQFGKLFYIGTSKGFNWFSYKDENCTIARIGFKSYLKQRNVQDIYIQLEGSSIYYYGLDESIKIVNNLLIDLCIPIVEMFVSRIDLNIFCNISFAKLDTSWINTVSRSESQIFTIKNSKNIETVYFGKRSNGKVLRIYNKINEMKKDRFNEKNLILINKLKKFKLFDTFENSTIWNVELELHRKYIKKKYMINTLSDMLSNLKKVFLSEMSRFKILYKDMKKIKYLKSDKNKLKELKIWVDIKLSYSKDILDFVGIRKKLIPYQMTKNALFIQLLDVYKKYRDYNPKENYEIQDFMEDFINYISIENFGSSESDNDFYKFIDLDKFDKYGLLRKKDKILRPFYLDTDI